MTDKLDIRKIVSELFDEVERIEKCDPELHPRAMMYGMLTVIIPSLYRALRTDSYMQEFAPKELQDLIERIKQKEVMRKLES